MNVKLIFLLSFFAIGQFSNAQDADSLNRFDADGLKTGKWQRVWFESGKVSSIEYFVAGKKNGLCLYFNTDGRLTNEIEYVNDTIHGVFKFFYPGGKEVSDFKKGRKEGFTRYFDYTGHLVEEYEFRNNKRNGFHRMYSKSGRVVMESTYINGRENGTRRSYSDNDKREVLLEADFVDDIRKEIRYFKNGKLIKIVKDENPQTFIEG